MISLPEFAIKNRSVVITAVALLVIWGVFSFLTMPRREDPEFTIMTCVVNTRWEGASADKIEELVTDPLEEALDGIEEVDVLRSISINGLSTIYVDLDESMDPVMVDQVWDQVRARVRNVQMPAKDIKPVVTDDFGDTSVILFAVYQEPLAGQDQVDLQYAYTDRELDVYSERVRDALRLLPGVAKASRFGVRDEAIYIETNAGTWSLLNLTSSDLEQLVSSRNIVESGGMLDTEDGRFYVKPGGELDAVEEINSIVADWVSDGTNSNQVYLKDLGLTVRRAYEDPAPLICRFGDRQRSRSAVMVALTMKSGANIVEICDAAKHRVEELQEIERELPEDIAVVAVSDQSLSVNSRIRDVVVNVIEAIVIVIVVVYLVVGFRTATVMAANIPFVVLASIGIITLFGVQLEQMSLASIVIALGLLVDNAVQVCDQSRTNQIAGMKPAEATVRGANLLAMPMLNGTLTTIAAFIPMIIAIEGGKKEFIYSLPVTLSTILAVSWILAMTLCVILAAAFIRPPKYAGQPSSPLARLANWISKRSKKQPGAAVANSPSESSSERVYTWIAGLAIRYKFLTLMIAVGFLLWTFRLPVGSEFFPQTERDQFAIEVWLPENVNIEQTNQAARKVEDLVRRLSPTTDDQGATVEQLRAMRTLVGGGGSRWYLSWNPESRKANYAEILVRTQDPKQTHQYAERIREVAKNGDPVLGIKPLPGVRVVPIELMFGPAADPVLLRVIGKGFADIGTLRQVADEVKKIVHDQPETWNVNDSWGIDGLQLRVDVDEDRANLAGVTNSQIASTLNAYYSGRLLTHFREGDHTVPVYFRLYPKGRRSYAEIESAYIEGNVGKIPLQSIATVQQRWEPAVIERRDLNRTIEVGAQVYAGVSGNDVVDRIMGSPEMQLVQDSLPPGFRIEIGGALEESQEGSAMMLKSFSLSFVVILLLLVIQFNSMSKAIVIITTLPLALSGSLLGLWLTQNPLGFMPQLGILSLFGIVLNTGIIFIEFADILIRQRSKQSDGSGPFSGLTLQAFREALADAGKQRLLPIFLTTATTVGGLIPLAVSGGPLWTGMAWLMVYGLLVATLLTLLVLPALYAIVVEFFRIRPVSDSE